MVGEYILGVGFSFVSTILHSWANVIDNYFSNKIFKRLSTLIFLSGLVSLIFLPLVFFIDIPHLVSFNAFVIIFFMALIGVLYQYPYYWSLRHSNTSVVISLFSLGKIFVPLFAFLLVKEHLGVYQYIGFFLIVISSIFLTLNVKKLRFNKAFFLMLVVSVILSMQAVLYKYLFEQGVGWASSFVWTIIFEVLIAGVMVLTPKNIRDFKESAKKIKKLGLLFVLAEFLSLSGEAAYSYAIFLIPVSIVKGITSTQSIFVLLCAIFFASKFPNLFKEYLGKDGLLKKIILFVLVVIGTILTIT